MRGVEAERGSSTNVCDSYYHGYLPPACECVLNVFEKSCFEAGGGGGKQEAEEGGREFKSLAA